MISDLPSSLYGSADGAWNQWGPFHPHFVGKIDFGLASRFPAMAVRRQVFSPEVDGDRRSQTVAAMHFSGLLRQLLSELAASHLVGPGYHVGWQRGFQADSQKRPETEVHEESFRAAYWVRDLKIVNEQRGEGALETPHLQEDRREVKNRRGDSFEDY